MNLYLENFKSFNIYCLLEPVEVDKIYQVLKQATEISNNKPRIEIVEPSTSSVPGNAEVSKLNIGYKMSARPIGATDSMLTASAPPCAPNSGL